MNNSKIKATLLFLFVANFFFANAQNNFSFQDLNWLAGSWIDEDSTMVEKWVVLNDFFMSAQVNVYRSSEYDILEFISIEKTDSTVVYSALPKQNSDWAEFKLISAVNDTWVFENSKHDFPKTIEYKKVNINEINIKLSGEEKNTEFTYFRFKPEEKTND